MLLHICALHISAHGCRLLETSEEIPQVQKTPGNAQEVYFAAPPVLFLKFCRKMRLALELWFVEGEHGCNACEPQQTAVLCFHQILSCVDQVFPFVNLIRLCAALSSTSKAAIPWPSAVETPTVWVRGLTRQPFWDCHKVQPDWTVQPDSVRFSLFACNTCEMVSKGKAWLTAYREEQSDSWGERVKLWHWNHWSKFN